MLAVDRALMSNPMLMLLDEPSPGLSPMNVRELGKIVRNINERGISVILVEQNAKLALSLAKYACVLETGNIVLQGKAEELMNTNHVRKAYLGQ